MARYPALDLRFAAGPGAGTLQDMLYAELDPFEPVAIQEHESSDGWRVFFRTAAHRDSARRALASEFENALDVHSIDVDDEDWARRSQASLNPARAGRIVVAPPWDVPGARDSRFALRASETQESASGDSNREPRTANRDTVTIIIDPSTGFGTGHHATTRLCLELLQEIDLHGKRVIDVGTGSGVLAIAASKLGAPDVVAIDNDPDALRNARENVQRNGVPVEVLEAELGELRLRPADIVLANLTGAVLRRAARTLQTLAAPGGVLIVSGFSAADLADVGAALGGAIRSVRSANDEWVAAVLTLDPETPQTNGHAATSNLD